MNPTVFSDNIASFHLSGPDITDLLHRVSTVNVKGMELSHPHPALFCAANGKIISFFLLTKISSTQYTVTLDVGLGRWNEQAFLNTLERYTFSEKYQLTPNADLMRTQNIPTALERIQNFWSAIDFEIPGSEMVAPLDLNLRSAISDQKGCFPGQEIIEKIISIGNPPFRLVRVEWTDTVPSRTEILNAGTVTTSEGRLSLAIVRKTVAQLNHVVTSASGITGKITEVCQ